MVPSYRARLLWGITTQPSRLRSNPLCARAPRLPSLRAWRTSARSDSGSNRDIWLPTTAEPTISAGCSASAAMTSSSRHISAGAGSRYPAGRSVRRVKSRSRTGLGSRTRTRVTGAATAVGTGCGRTCTLRATSTALRKLISRAAPAERAHRGGPQRRGPGLLLVGLLGHRPPRHPSRRRLMPPTRR